jgi:hypothetical protein
LIESAVGCGIELALVGDQDVDGALELDRHAERVVEPDVEILRRRGNALRRDGAHGLFGHPGHVLEIQLVERVGQGRALVSVGIYLFLLAGYGRSHEIVKCLSICPFPCRWDHGGEPRDKPRPAGR